MSNEPNKETAQSPQTAVDPFDPNSFKSPANMTGESKPTGNCAEVKLIVFDMGHVFVDFNWDEVCKGFCARSSLSREEFRQVLSHLGSLGYEAGRISTADFLRELNDKARTNITLDEFKTLWNHTFQENVMMAALLQSLKANYPLYLLSNTNEIHYDYLQTSFNVARHFQELILSYQVGVSKPDQRIYQEVLKRSGLPAQHCLFIDDLLPNVLAAQALGMQTIQFAGIEDLKNRLSLLGVRL